MQHNKLLYIISNNSAGSFIKGICQIYAADYVANNMRFVYLGFNKATCVNYYNVNWKKTVTEYKVILSAILKHADDYNR